MTAFKKWIAVTLLFALMSHGFAQERQSGIAAYASDLVAIVNGEKNPNDLSLAAEGFRYRPLGMKPGDASTFYGELQQLRVGLKNFQFRARRVLTYRHSIAVQGVITGQHTGEFQGITATGRRVGVEAMLLGRITEGRLRSLVAYLGQDVLVQQVSVEESNTFPIPEPPKNIRYSGELTVRLNDELTSRIYGISGYALAARLAGLQGEHALARPAVANITIQKARAAQDDVKPYTGSLNGLRLRPEQIFGAGNFVVVRLTGKARYKNSGKPVSIEVVTVAQLANGAVNDALVYINTDSLLD